MLALWFRYRLIAAFLAVITFTTTTCAPSRGRPGLACPGVTAGVCARDCRLHICKQLAAFYKATNNIDPNCGPWESEYGWELTNTTSCDQLLAAAGSSQPFYCSWFGITCCDPAGLAAASCSVVGAVAQLNMPMNNINGSIDASAIVRPLQELHACGLTVVNLEANSFTGTLTDDWSEMYNLRVLDLGNSWITGMIPASFQNLRNLTVINLSNTWISGTLPPWLNQLVNLERLNLGQTWLEGTFPEMLAQMHRLQELNLESTGISGVLPDNLCHERENSTLIQLSIRNNALTGSAKVLENCKNLVQLDISANQFTGVLPASPSWTQLTTYHANDNAFTGTLPTALCLHARILRDLDISNNQMTGIIPDRIGLLASIESLNVANNRFSGPITENLFYFPGLRRLDLSNNQLVGTLPAYALQFTYALLSADISNNTNITGNIPPQMGFAKNLRIATLTGTSLSCSGVIRPFNISVSASCQDPKLCKTWQVHEPAPGAVDRLCTETEALPCFLRFSEDSMPRDDDSNMRCKLILRKLPKDAQRDCAGDDGMYLLGGEAATLPDIRRTNLEQQWILDPSYYQYRGCSCLMGFAEQWSHNGTKLTCVEMPSADRRTMIIISAISAVAGLAVLSAIVLIIALYLRTQPRWLRERVMQAKRMQGAPKCTKPGEKVDVSVVVTDVKDFSALTRAHPDAMIKAMGGHNNILRKACHAHAGYVLDQEGDSWTIAFHDAEDAVAFSLQVQQALSRKVWVLRLPNGAPTGQSDKLTPEPSQPSDIFTVRGRNASLGSTVDSRFTVEARVASHTADQVHLFNTAHAPPGTLDGTPSQYAVRSSLHEPVAAAAAAAVDGTDLAAAAPTDQQQQQARSTQPSPPPSSDLHNLIRSHGQVVESFTSSVGRRSSHSGSEHPSSHTVPSRSEPGAQQRGPLSWLFGRQLSSSSKGSSSGMHEHMGQLSLTSETHPHLDIGPGGPAVPAEAYQQQQQQPDIEIGSIHSNQSSGSREHKKQQRKQQRQQQAQGSRGSGASFGSTMSYSTLAEGSGRRSTMESGGSSSSRLQNVSAALLHRFTTRSGRSGTLVGPLSSSSAGAAGLQQPSLKALRISVRIGIASGGLPYGCDVRSSSIAQRAKELVSDVANGGQVLLDEPTFLLIKDSLSMLGTVNENGYDDTMLQRLMNARVLGAVKQQAACQLCMSRELSFSTPLATEEPQDYEHDAIVVHMGCFEVETPVPLLTTSDEKGDKEKAPHKVSKDPAGTGKEKEKAGKSKGDKASKDPSPAEPQKSETDLELLFVDRQKSRSKLKNMQVQQLHLYSIAGPGMRRWPENTQDLSAALSWADPVNVKPGWVQVQKGYWQAPGARQMDLTPSARLTGHSQAPLPDVTIVFISVAESLSFTAKQSSSTVHAVNQAIVRVMLQYMAAIPGKDGYLCRFQEADLKYMCAFEQAHHAVQWCLMVQEALLYVDWEPQVLKHPGFGEVWCPETGRPMFRGPRLRMGLSEGQPSSVLPDHTGRANYYGERVIRAARFMDAAAHGGQLVTNLELVRQLMMNWIAQDREGVVQQSGSSFTASRGSGPNLGPNVGTGQDQAEHQQSLPLPLPLVVRSPIPPIAEGQLLESHLGQLHKPIMRHSSDDLHSGNTLALLEHHGLPPRSNSWSVARHHRPDSAAAAAGTAAAAALRVTWQEISTNAAAAAAAAGADAADNVFAVHLGRFRFKGTGEYEMVQLLHGCISARIFPCEPPRGKGERLSQERTGAVKDLPAVKLQVPAALQSARRAFQQQMQKRLQGSQAEDVSL